MLQHFTQHAWLIGERLTKAKELLPHGTFQPYVKETLSYTPQYARNFMNVYTDNPKGIPSFFLPSLKHLFEVSTLPSEVDRQYFVEQPHTIPSTGETKTVDEMTVRELREVKAELKRKQAELDEATDKAEQAETARQIAEDKAEIKKNGRLRLAPALLSSNQVRTDVARYYPSKSRHLTQFHTTL